METKLRQLFLLVNSYGFYVKNRNRFHSYWFHVYVTFLPYTWKRIRENFHVYVIFYVSYVNYLYITWRWKSLVIVASYIRHSVWNWRGPILFRRFINLSHTYLLRHLPTYLHPRDTHGASELRKVSSEASCIWRTISREQTAHKA